MPYARKIVGWRVSTTAHAAFVLAALEQAVHDGRPAKGLGLVHHSHRGSQYLSIRDSEPLADSGIEPSAGSVGESYDNARVPLTIHGLPSDTLVSLGVLHAAVVMHIEYDFVGRKLLHDGIGRRE